MVAQRTSVQNTVGDCIICPTRTLPTARCKPPQVFRRREAFFLAQSWAAVMLPFSWPWKVSICLLCNLESVYFPCLRNLQREHPPNRKLCSACSIREALSHLNCLGTDAPRLQDVPISLPRNAADGAENHMGAHGGRLLRPARC